MSGYRLTVQYALKSITNSKTLLIVWFHLVYTWNLAARLASAVNIRTNCFGKSIDCFYINFANHKGDEDGDNSWPKHIYSNILDPLICPHLVLAVVVLCDSGGLGTSSAERLFGVSTAGETFTSWLNLMMNSLTEDELLRMDCTANYSVLDC